MVEIISLPSGAYPTKTLQLHAAGFRHKEVGVSRGVGGSHSGASRVLGAVSEGGGKLASSWDFYAFCCGNLETTSKDLAYVSCLSFIVASAARRHALAGYLVETSYLEPPISSSRCNFK